MNFNEYKNIRKHPLYQIWKGMRARCLNSDHKSYNLYGGRGILPCTEWDDYVNFYTWSLENGWASHLSLDRIDNNGPYSPDNCRWATYKQQANNTSSNLKVTAFGETKTASEWADDIRCSVPLNTLYQRLELQWIPEEAISLPSRRKATARPLTFDQYQAIAEYTAKYPNKGTIDGLVYCLLGLASESGEVCGKLKKIIRDNNGELTDDTRKALAAELSDCLWYCAAIASELNMSLGSVAQYNLDKLQSRADRNVISGDGDNR